VSFDDEINRLAARQARQIRDWGDGNTPSKGEMQIQQYVQWLMRNRIPFDEHAGRVWSFLETYSSEDSYGISAGLDITFDGQIHLTASMSLSGYEINTIYLTRTITDRVARSGVPWSSTYDVQLATRQGLHARTDAAKKKAEATVMQERAFGEAERAKERAVEDERRDELVAQFFLWVRDSNVPYNHRRLRPGAKPGFWSEKYKERDYERLVLLGSLDKYGWHVLVTDTGMRTVHRPTPSFSEEYVKKAIKEMVDKTGIPWPHGNLD
jgi:hypothetical protein